MENLGRIEVGYFQFHKEISGFFFNIMVNFLVNLENVPWMFKVRANMCQRKEATDRAVCKY